MFNITTKGQKCWWWSRAFFFKSSWSMLTQFPCWSVRGHLMYFYCILCIIILYDIYKLFIMLYDLCCWKRKLLRIKLKKRKTNLVVIRWAGVRAYNYILLYLDLYDLKSNNTFSLLVLHRTSYGTHTGTTNAEYLLLLHGLNTAIRYFSFSTF